MIEKFKIINHLVEFWCLCHCSFFHLSSDVSLSCSPAPLLQWAQPLQILLSRALHHLQTPHPPPAHPNLPPPLQICNKRQRQPCPPHPLQLHLAPSPQGQRWSDLEQPWPPSAARRPVQRAVNEQRLLLRLQRKYLLLMAWPLQNICQVSRDIQLQKRWPPCFWVFYSFLNQALFFLNSIAVSSQVVLLTVTLLCTAVFAFSQFWGEKNGISGQNTNIFSGIQFFSWSFLFSLFQASEELNTESKC